MAKVFRLHSNGVGNLNGWGNSNKYTSAQIGQIGDPSGDTARREITSIPSPFARMDLVRTAFARVTNMANTDPTANNTIHHKMVSHALDVAQMFFNYDKLHQAGLMNLIHWTKSNITDLKASSNDKHQLLGNTLDLFMVSDNHQFNFDLLNGLYMLRYVGEGAPKELTIIGSTSPASLFYTSANDHSFLKGKIRFGQHEALSSDDFEALKDRADKEFIVWFFALSKFIPNFAALFPEVNRYLQMTYSHLDHSLQTRINALQTNTFSNNYDSLHVAPGIPVEIMNFPLSQSRTIDPGQTSSFAIKATKPVAKRPLVLPVDAFARKWKYVTDYWQPGTQVPVNDSRPVNQRVLPSENIPHPYLTMGDFLEDVLIMSESKPNAVDFFNGNLADKTSGEHSFLLPVKKAYFDYFTADDLRKHLSMECSGTATGISVKVTLTIPVEAGSIVYERFYLTDATTMNPKNGSIVPRDFTIILFPNVRFMDGTTPDYIAGLMTLDDDWAPSLTAIDGENNILAPSMGPVDRNQDAAGNRVDRTAPMIPMSSYDHNFEYLQLNANSLAGIAVPNWSGVAGGETYEFAVDFGTSNTHIEYRTHNTPVCKPLDISAEKCQLATYNSDALENPTYSIALKSNLIPMSMGARGEIHFPMKTLLSYKRATNWQTPTSPYITGNLPFYFGSTVTPTYNEVKSNLKWNTDQSFKAMVQCYLGSLMHVIRNKVVMEGGNLEATTIKWFYPTSMPQTMVTDIASVWSNLYKKHIGSDLSHLQTIPESIAPYYFYQSQFGAGVDVLSVDIGGGTSDAYIVDSNGHGAYITSFRFAANSLLGDGFISSGLNQNGFVKKFRPIIESILTANNLSAVKTILDEVANNQNSADYLSLLFTLKDNPDVVRQKCDSQLNFIEILRGSAGAKTLVLVFYTAIIYHLAKFIKTKQAAGAPIKEPAILAFSGNGSKLLQILGVDNDMGRKALANYTKAIFEKVNGHKYPHNSFQLIIDPDKPKEATCKGALSIRNLPQHEDIETMKDTLLGTADDSFIGQRNYNTLTKADMENLAKEINNFTDVFFQLASEQRVEQKFGTIPANKLEKHRAIFNRDTETRTNNALTITGMLGSANPIEDTLFFYPIVVALNELAKTIL